MAKQARLEAIDAELRQLDPEIERLAKRQKRAEQKAVKNIPLLTLSLCFLYVIAGYNGLISSSYLAGQGLPHGQQRLETFPGEFLQKSEDALAMAFAFPDVSKSSSFCFPNLRLGSSKDWLKLMLFGIRYEFGIWGRLGVLWPPD